LFVGRCVDLDKEIIMRKYLLPIMLLTWGFSQDCTADDGTEGVE